MSNQSLGRAGEEAAADFLRQKGYEILARNYRARVGEIDLIAWQKPRTLIFVEVKTRHGDSFGQPALAVNFHKKQKIIMTAHWYLRENRREDCYIRFDVVEVYAMPGGTFRLRHYESAFEA